MMEYPHSGQSIYSHVMNVFREYEISGKKKLVLLLTMLHPTMLLLRFLNVIYNLLMVVNFIMLDVVVT